jgi:hypothetical protein
MLQKLGDHIKACQQRALEAENRAAQTTNHDLQAEYFALAKQWAHLARSYEYSESLERFLLDAQKAKDEMAPEPPQ